MKKIKKLTDVKKMLDKTELQMIKGGNIPAGCSGCTARVCPDSCGGSNTYGGGNSGGGGCSGASSYCMPSDGCASWFGLGTMIGNKL